MAENQEIERKFKVVGEYKSLAIKSYAIKQGYLCSDPTKTVRARIKGDKGYLTIKGRAEIGHFGRFEWEKEISVEDAELLLALCGNGLIDKYRYIVPYQGKTWEVDEFYGENAGLVMAEIELESEDEAIEKPSFIGDEVTGDKRYYNSHLLKNPYKEWKE